MKNLFSCGSKKATDAVADPAETSDSKVTTSSKATTSSTKKTTGKKPKTDDTPIIGETATHSTEALNAEEKQEETTAEETPAATAAPVEEAAKTEPEAEKQTAKAAEETPAKKGGFFSKLFAAATGTSQKNLDTFADQQIIFVLGQPGSGKGTQCTSLAKEYGFLHISAGDLLRAEVLNSTEHGKMIDEYIKEGKIVPVEITLALLRKAMEKETKAKGFLIDGFPRQIDQAEAFESTIRQPNLILFFNCPEDILLPRLLKRGETSGRTDDNEESIKKRFKTFNEISVKCVERYSAMNKIIEVDASKDVASVWADLEKALKERNIAPVSST